MIWTHAGGIYTPKILFGHLLNPFNQKLLRLERIFINNFRLTHKNYSDNLKQLQHNKVFSIEFDFKFV